MKTNAGCLVAFFALLAAGCSTNPIHKVNGWFGRSSKKPEPPPQMAPAVEPAAEPAPVSPAPASLAPEIRSSAVDASTFKTFLKSWSSASGDAKAKLRDFLARWQALPDEDKEVFLKLGGLSEEDKALFLQLVMDSGAR